MLSQIHLCLLPSAHSGILLTEDICLEELVSPGMKDREGCSINSLCTSLFVLVNQGEAKAQSHVCLQFLHFFFGPFVQVFLALVHNFDF